MNLLLLDDCGRSADEYQVVGFDHLRVIPLPSLDDISIPGLNDVIREQLSEMPDDTTILAFTHTMIHPDEIRQIVRKSRGCTFVCRGDDLVDIVVLPGMPDIPERDERDFYDILEDQYDVDYAESYTASVATETAHDTGNPELQFPGDSDDEE